MVMIDVKRIKARERSWASGLGLELKFQIIVRIIELQLVLRLKFRGQWQSYG